MRRMKVQETSILCNLKVLYVEDEDFSRDEMVKFLKRRVGKLYTAENGLQGIEAFKRHTPHIIITDLKMAVMDGLQMIKTIRSMGYDSSIIITSALSDTETILQAVDVGIVKYVVKPINPRDLVHIMEKVGKEIFKNQLKETVLKDTFILDKEKKNGLEKKIKSEVAHFIKLHSGRGPKDIQVFIEGNLIDIKAYDTLTNFELHLISNNRNHSLVEYNRRLFYIEGSKVLEKKVETILNNPVKLCNVICNCRNNMDKIGFLIL